MIIGYARISTKHQNLDFQVEALEKYGCDRIYKEQMTGSRMDRPELNEMLDYARKGDLIVVWKLDRLGRSLKHLIKVMNDLDEKGVDFVSLNENIDTTTPYGKFMFNMFATIAEFEREMAIERSRAGLESARARGRIGGRPRVDKNKMEKVLDLYDKKVPVKEICELYNVGRSTVYNYLDERKERNEK